MQLWHWRKTSHSFGWTRFGRTIYSHSFIHPLIARTYTEAREFVSKNIPWPFYPQHTCAVPRLELFHPHPMPDSIAWNSCLLPMPFVLVPLPSFGLPTPCLGLPKYLQNTGNPKRSSGLQTVLPSCQDMERGRNGKTMRDSNQVVRVWLLRGYELGIPTASSLLNPEYL